MTKPIDVNAVENATGKTWTEWLKFLDKLSAASLSHKEIAQAVRDKGGVTNWWAQTITVAYEQHIERRRPGQTSDGKYQVAISKTVDGTLDEALHKWLDVVAGRKDFAKVPIARTPATSRSPKFRYWRCGLGDGSRVNVGISQKDSRKVVIAIGHENLASFRQIERWRVYWKDLLATVSGRSAPDTLGAQKSKTARAASRRPPQTAQTTERH
jgi:hypothetical protein